MAKIKYLKKFKKYNMRVANATIYLICKDDDVLERDIELNDRKLIKETKELGKCINDTINSFYKEKINQIKERFISNGVNEEDSKTLKLHSDIISYNENNFISTNNSIIKFIRESSYGCYKESKEDTDVVTSNDENLTLKDIDFFYCEIVDYNFFNNAYQEIYNFLKDNGVNVEDLSSPSNIMSLIKWENYGIGTPTEIKKILPYEETITTKKIKNYIESQLNLLLDLLEKNKENIDYSPIIDKINYIPLDIKNFFNYIMNNNPNNKYSHKIYDKIICYINTYGVPFWTEDIKIPRSKVDYSCIDIPLNNFIFICLSIYVYSELWEFFNKYYKKYDDWDRIDFLNQALNILNINYLYDRDDTLEELGLSIRNLDININNEYNKIFGYNLKIYRDRVWNKKEKIFTVKYIYENYIIGAWDIFFMYYFGSDARIDRHFCVECHKEFIGKGHKSGTLCDECYKIIFNENNRERVRKCRAKQGRSDNESDKSSTKVP